MRAVRHAAATAAFASALVFAAPLPGAEQVLGIDPDASEITFTLGATLHTVHGSAPLESGLVRFDLESGAASGEIVVDAAKLETGNERRDRDMHQKVLESETHPRIVLRCDAVAGSLEEGATSRVELEGRFEIHGEEHPLTLAAEATLDGSRLEVETTFRVPYVEWGMEDPSKLLLRVEKHVDVTIRAVGTLEDAP